TSRPTVPPSSTSFADWTRNASASRACRPHITSRFAAVRDSCHYLHHAKSSPSSSVNDFSRSFSYGVFSKSTEGSVTQPPRASSRLWPLQASAQYQPAF
ncbi:hypothetical protein M422DRAFT_34599, partial [Sphaerobolus stellatus SS14]